MYLVGRVGLNPLTRLWVTYVSYNNLSARAWLMCVVVYQELHGFTVDLNQAMTAKKVKIHVFVCCTLSSLCHSILYDVL